MNIIMLAIVGGVLLVFAGIGVFLYMRHEKTKKNKVLASIKGNKNAGNEPDAKDLQNKRRAELAKKLKESDTEESDKEKNPNSLSNKLERGGLSISASQFWTFSAVFAGAVTVISYIAGMSPGVTAVIAAVSFFILPRWFLKRRINKRQKQFLEEFPDVLEAMVRLLKAGMPVSEAISMAGKEFTGPVGEEMSRIYETQKIGVPLPEAVNEAARRVPITEMQMFATGISIQTQTGASLSEVLLNLSGVIRARFKLQRKVKALSQEAKSSAMIIGALPFIVGGGMYAINPEYAGLMFTNTGGRIAMIGGGIWTCLGIFVMKMMINIKV